MEYYGLETFENQIADYVYVKKIEWANARGMNVRYLVFEYQEKGIIVVVHWRGHMIDIYKRSWRTDQVHVKNLSWLKFGRLVFGALAKTVESGEFQKGMTRGFKAEWGRYEREVFGKGRRNGKEGNASITN